MGTNYYLMQKKDYNLSKKLWKARNAVVDNTDFRKIFTDLIELYFKDPLDIARKNNLDLQEIFKDRVEDAVNQLASSIDFDISYVFDISDNKSVHIGKSSFGWLFNFQIQDTYLNDIPVKWCSYKDVFNCLEKLVVRDKTFIIVDEYGDTISYRKFKSFVDTKQRDEHNLSNPDNFTHCRNIDGYRFSNGDFS